MIQDAPRPANAMIVVMSVQLRKVCFSDSPKYFPTSQNPLSFTWENPVAPEAIAMTIKAISGAERFAEAKTGAVMPAEVIMATVAEPCRIRTNAAITNPKISGFKRLFSKAEAIISPAPVSINTCLKAPPAPVSKIITPAASKDLVPIFCKNSLDIPLLTPMKYQANRFATISAVNGCPNNTITSDKPDSGRSKINSLVKSVFRTIKKIGTAIMVNIKAGLGASSNGLSDSEK